jgi:hypothetical protein
MEQLGKWDQGVINLLRAERFRCTRLADTMRDEIGLANEESERVRRLRDDLAAYGRRIDTLSYLLRCCDVD